MDDCRVTCHKITRRGILVSPVSRFVPLLWRYLAEWSQSGPQKDYFQLALDTALPIHVTVARRRVSLLSWPSPSSWLSVHSISYIQKFSFQALNLAPNLHCACASKEMAFPRQNACWILVHYENVVLPNEFGVQNKAILHKFNSFNLMK